MSDKLILLPGGQLVYALERAEDPEKLAEFTRMASEAMKSRRMLIFDSVEVIDARSDTPPIASYAIHVQRPDVPIAAVEELVAKH